jgi:hypothetical protein
MVMISDFRATPRLDEGCLPMIMLVAHVSWWKRAVIVYGQVVDGDGKGERKIESGDQW